MSEHKTTVCRGMVHVGVRSIDRDVEIEFAGYTTTGSRVDCKVIFRWEFLPHLQESIATAWRVERERRLNNIAKVDAATGFIT